MIRFEVRSDGSRRWRLVNRTPYGADVLAYEAGGAAGPPWREALERLRNGRGALDVVAVHDGHFGWVLRAPDGSAIAESPPVHRDPELCRVAFTDAQRAARTALGSHADAVGADIHHEQRTTGIAAGSSTR